LSRLLCIGSFAAAFHQKQGDQVFREMRRSFRQANLP
jgi:hypothetical protein